MIYEAWAFWRNLRNSSSVSSCRPIIHLLPLGVPSMHSPNILPRLVVTMLLCLLFSISMCKILMCNGMVKWAYLQRTLQMHILFTRMLTLQSRLYRAMECPTLRLQDTARRQIVRSQHRPSLLYRFRHMGHSRTQLH